MKSRPIPGTIVHAVVFGILLYFISKIVHQYNYGIEKFQVVATKKECNVEHCNRVINEELAKGPNMDAQTPFIPTVWWGTGQGCEGCTVPSAITVIPPIGTSYDDISIDILGRPCLFHSYGGDQGVSNMKNINEASDEEKKVTNMKKKCNVKKCNKIININKKNGKMMSSSFWTRGKACEGCTLPQNNIIISKEYLSTNSVPPYYTDDTRDNYYCLPANLYPG